jgi:hypothetical protein
MNDRHCRAEEAKRGETLSHDRSIYHDTVILIGQQVKFTIQVKDST